MLAEAQHKGSKLLASSSSGIAKDDNELE